MRSKTLAGLLVAAGLAATPASGALAAETAVKEIVSHPSELSYGPLEFSVPRAKDYRHALGKRGVAYVVEDRAFPLVRISVSLRSGSFLEPADKVGLAALTASMMREGGTTRLSAEEFDERVDFLASVISSSASDTQASVTLNCLTSALDESLDLFFEMLRTPGFQKDRLEVEKGTWIETMKQRNDDAGDILNRQWDWLIHGEDHFSSRRAKQAHIDSITREDLIAFHRKHWRPDNLVLAVSGDVNAAKIVADLDRRLKAWKAEGTVEPPWPPTPPAHSPAPGLYHVEKDIPQGKVRIGHLGSRWDNYDNPDNYALMVMNDILGGGGFTSRITKRVRSDEGLAYSAGSSFGIGVWWPGTFQVFFQSKNPTVAYAAKLSFEEIERIRKEPVSEDELTVSRNSFIDTFPRSFESANQIAQIFARDEYIGRPHSYWHAYRDNIRKVTAADVQRVAREYLKPDRAVFLVVGKWAEIEKGDADGRASMKEFFGGKVNHLPLRDPLTLEPLTE